MQEYTEELYKKDLHDQDNHDGVITHLEPDILECEVKWALESISSVTVMLVLLSTYLRMKDLPFGLRPFMDIRPTLSLTEFVSVSCRPSTHF